MRIAEGSQHTAQVGGDVLQDEGGSHVLILARGGEREITQRQEGQQCHIIGNEHRADEGDVHQREYRHAQITCHADDFLRDDGEEANVSQGADDCQRYEQTGQRLIVQIIGIGGIGRHKAHRKGGSNQSNAQYGIASEEAEQGCQQSLEGK